MSWSDSAGDSQMLGFIDWEQFQETCKSIITKTDEYPERYFVEDFPAKEIIDSLKFKELG